MCTTQLWPLLNPDLTRRVHGLQLDEVCIPRASFLIERINLSSANDYLYVAAVDLSRLVVIRVNKVQACATKCKLMHMRTDVKILLAFARSLTQLKTKTSI